MHECFRISWRVTESAPLVSRRRAANRRELLLPLRMPELYQTGIAFDPCLPPCPTGIISDNAGEPAEAWTRPATHCSPAKQISPRIEGAIVALIAGNDLLARLIFRRIRPRTHSGRMGGQSSPHELRRTRAASTPPDITMSPLDARGPARPLPEIETLFTQLARRRLPKCATEMT